MARDKDAEAKEIAERVRRAAAEYNAAVMAGLPLGLRVDASLAQVPQSADKFERLTVDVTRRV